LLSPAAQAVDRRANLATGNGFVIAREFYKLYGTAES
jgi:hypothetical protein